MRGGYEPWLGGCSPPKARRIVEGQPEKTLVCSDVLAAPWWRGEPIVFVEPDALVPEQPVKLVRSIRPKMQIWG